MTFETNKLTQKIKGLLTQASVLAERYRQSELEPEHLLLVMLGQSGGDVPQLLAKLSVPVDTVTDEVRRAMLRFPFCQGENNLSLSQRVQHLLMKAQEEAEFCGDPSIGVEHILQALLASSQGGRGEPQSGYVCNVGDILLNHGINRETVAGFFDQSRRMQQGSQIASPDEERGMKKMSQTILPNEEQEMWQTQRTVPADESFEMSQTPQTPAADEGSQIWQRPQIVSQGFKKWKASQTLKADEDLKMWQTQQTEIPDEDLGVWRTQQTDTPDEDIMCQTQQEETPDGDIRMWQTPQTEMPNQRKRQRLRTVTIDEDVEMWQMPLAETNGEGTEMWQMPQPETEPEGEGTEIRENPQTLLQGFKKWKTSQTIEVDEDMMWQTQQTKTPDEDIEIPQMPQILRMSEMLQMPKMPHMSKTPQTPQTPQMLLMPQMPKMSQIEIPDEDPGKFQMPQTAPLEENIGTRQMSQPENPKGRFIFRERHLTSVLEEKVEKALIQASEMASRHKQSEVEPEHLLMVMLWKPNGVVPQVLNRLSVPIDAVKKEVRHSIMRFPNRIGEVDLTVSPRLRFLLMNAQLEAERCGDPYISSEHILLAFVLSAKGKKGSKREKRSAFTREAGDVLIEWGVNQDAVLSVFNEVGWFQQESPMATPDEDFGMPQTESPDKVRKIRKTLQAETLNEIRKMWQPQEMENLNEERGIGQAPQNEAPDVEDMMLQSSQAASSDEEDMMLESFQPTASDEDNMMLQSPHTSAMDEELAPAESYGIQPTLQSQPPVEDYWKQQMPQPATWDEDYLIWQIPQTANPNTESFFMSLDSEQTEWEEKGNRIIITDKLCKNFGTGLREQQVLKNLDIDIYEQGFTVIVGPVDAGKSTLLYTLSGMDSPTSGSIRFFGKDISELSVDEMAEFRRENCGFIFQNMCLLDNMSIMENILASSCFINSDRSSIVAQAQDLLTGVGLSEGIWRKFPAQLSSEENQLGAIVRVLINKPRVIFADEPTGSLNSVASVAVLDMLTDANNNGQSLIMVTHDLNSAIRGDRILYMRNGAIRGQIALGKYMNGDQTRQDRLVDFLAEMGS